MDLDALKKALDEGTAFKGAEKLTEITKKADGIGELSGEEQHNLFEERDKRIESDAKNMTASQIKEMANDDILSIKKRNESEKNEMELAEIKFIENEILVIEEYINNLLEEVSDKKRQIDNHQIRIDEIKKEIE